MGRDQSLLKENISRSIDRSLDLYYCFDPFDCLLIRIIVIIIFLWHMLINYVINVLNCLSYLASCDMQKNIYIISQV